MSICLAIKSLSVRMNVRMRCLIGGGEPPASALSPQLARVAGWKFTHIDDCIVFSGQHQTSKRSDFPDRTGYEAYVNHIHIDDFVSERNPNSLIEQAFALASHLNYRLQNYAPATDFRFLIAANDEGCTLRFHVVRDGEQWETQDLELYAEEAVVAIDSGELRPPPKPLRYRRP